MSGIEWAFSVDNGGCDGEFSRVFRLHVDDVLQPLAGAHQAHTADTGDTGHKEKELTLAPNLTQPETFAGLHSHEGTAIASALLPQKNATAHTDFHQKIGMTYEGARTDMSARKYTGLRPSIIHTNTSTSSS